MNLELKAKLFLAALEKLNLPALHAGTPEEARATMRAIRRTAVPSTLAQATDIRIPSPSGDLMARLYTSAARARACLLYLHGGGWVLGGVEESDAFARELAVITRCAVVSLGYRLAPEAPFPAALEDSEAALQMIVDRSAELFGSALPLGVIGDSAGANLATVLACSVQGRSHIAFQILAYPITDARMDNASYREFGAGTHLTAAAMAWFWEHYVPDPAQRLDPRASPVCSPALAGAPPCFILTAESDPLRDEGEAYAAALRGAGVAVLCKRYEGQIHGFLTLVGLFDGGSAALADIAAYLDARLAVGVA